MEDQEIIRFYLDHGILLGPDMLDRIKTSEIPIKTDFAVITSDTLQLLLNKTPINIHDFEKSLVLKEKHRNTKMYSRFLEYIENNKNQIPATDHRGLALSPPTILPDQKPIADIKTTPTSTTPSSSLSLSTQPLEAVSTDLHEKKGPDESQSISAALSREGFLKEHKIKILLNYTEKSRKRTVNDFVNYFNVRFREIEKILRSRQELQNLTSISRIAGKKEKENVALIGMVYEKGVTKNNNIMLTLEDSTGTMKVVITKQKEDLFAQAQELQLDEVIGITGTYDGLVFANNILLPDIPMTKELKKSPEEGYFLVISDPQVGNKLFLEKEFNKLISWLNGEIGSEAQKEIATQIKYIFIVGDLVEGVGVYPDQEYDLSIIDIKDQYAAFQSYIERFPKVPIFICPGNHDVGRLSEPQPGFRDEYSKIVWDMPNVISLSNPSIVNIYSSQEKNFDGFDVLMYHGGSFFYYFANVPAIRQKGGAKRPDMVMKYLLQRRHLAPAHTSTLYVPDPKKDPLSLDKVPDFFFSGHVHRSSVNNYKNVTCINASCWVSKSDEQERRGLEPQPARAFLVNMQTREVKVMNFLSKEDQDKEPKEA
jgi:DNA polymerase II small subunit